MPRVTFRREEVTIISDHPVVVVVVVVVVVIFFQDKAVGRLDLELGVGVLKEGLECRVEIGRVVTAPPHVDERLFFTYPGVVFDGTPVSGDHFSDVAFVVFAARFWFVSFVRQVVYSTSGVSLLLLLLLLLLVVVVVVVVVFFTFAVVESNVTREKFVRGKFCLTGLAREQDVIQEFVFPPM